MTRLGTATDGKVTPVAHQRWRPIGAFVALFIVVLPPAVGAASWTIWNPVAGVTAAVLLGAVATVVLGRRLFLVVKGLEVENVRSLRLEHAVATSSRALLKRGTTDPIGTALAALLSGIESGTVFLESNVADDPDQNGNTSTVRDVLYPGNGGTDPGRWDLTPWRMSAVGRHALSSGCGFSPDPENLDPMTAAMYRAAQIGAESLFPITVEGTWIGNVGFTSADSSRAWTVDEERLLRIAAEMIGVYWERRDSKRRLEELLAAKDEFIASVSHEVRTPLTAVLGFAHELNEDRGRFSDQEQTDLIALMASQSQEVADIVDDLLIAARTAAGTIVVAPQVVSVRNVVGEVLASHSGRVHFSTVSGADIEMWADPGRTRQILRNLLTNAVRYGGDTVRIRVVSSDEHITIEVRDNGEGIPALLRDQVFEPYARAHKGDSQPASVGLGLSIARKLAHLMNGELELSRENDWTVFSLTLPAAPVPDPASPGVLKQPVGTP